MRLFSFFSEFARIFFTAMFLCILFALPFECKAVVHDQGEAHSAGENPSQDENDQTLYIVRLSAEPVATYIGGVPGYAPTSPRATRASRLDLDSAAVRSYRDFLQQQRTELLTRMEQTLGRALEPVHVYELSFNGMALRLSAAEAAQVGRHPEVESIVQDRRHQVKNIAEGNGAVFEDQALLALIERHGGKVAFNFAPAMLAVGLVLMSFAVYAMRRRHRRYALWLAGAALLLVTAACGSDGGSSLRIEWPGDKDTAPGAALINAPRVWFGSGTDSIAGGTMGEGIVVGIIDTGISPHSPSFAETGADGYTHTNPRGRYYGVCDPANTRLYNPNFPCNGKLIGAWALAEDNYNPVDFIGHGSHVAATAAGNFVEDAVVHTPSGLNISANISGVAPHAHIIAYNVAGADGSVSISGIMAAIEQVIIDEVDVVNYSIGSSSATNPWIEREESEMLPFLGAREAGVWVATSAGNDGPDEATLGDPAVAPWLNVVASSTHDVVYRNSVTCTGAIEGLEELHGLGLSAEYGPAEVVYAGDYGDPLCVGNFDAAFDGEIVICDRGENPRVEKGLNALENGAGGMILAEVDEGDASALMLDSHWLPATHISQPDGDKLKQWLEESQAKGEELMATLSGTYTLSDEQAADVISGFSSRGYNEAVPSLIKPDMAAPGSSIFAPVVDGLGYDIYQGTSMASPHVAGVLALLKARHPHWSPAQAQSALMTTSNTDIRRNAEGDPATPFDMGAGRVDAWNAMHAALVLDESGEGYRDANPELYWTTLESDKGDPAKINMPSLGEGACIGECSWTRTLSNVSTYTTSWDVSVAADTGLSLDVYPQSFTLAPGQSQVLEVYADCNSVSLQEWAFGRIDLHERQSLAPDAHLPVAIRSRQYHFPEKWEIETTQLQGSETLYRLQGTDVSKIVAWGLQPGEVVEDEIEPDPTPGDIINNDGGIFLLPLEVPAGTKALLIDLDSDESEDLDLYVGRDEDYENPEYTSAVSGPQERITVTSPEAGIWWIGVHNFEGGGGEADIFRLQYAMPGAAEVPEEHHAPLMVTPQHPLASPFELDLSWDVPRLEPDTYWYGAVEISMPDENVAIPVRLSMENDDPAADTQETVKPTFRREIQ